MPDTFSPYDPPASPLSDPHPSSRSAGRLGLASCLCSAVALALLLVCLAHVRADRTRRRPVVTYEGPAAVAVVPLGYLAAALLFAALTVAGLSIAREPTWRLNPLGQLGAAFAGAVMFGALFVLGAIYES